MQPQFITLGPKAKDITGQRFGRLVALGPVSHTKQGKMKWLFQCDCGNTSVTSLDALRNGNTQSCGCLKVELTPLVWRTHGMSDHPLYETWCGMIKRCTNPNDRKYSYYGGRGVTVYDEWRNSFESFHTYVSQLPYYGIAGYTLDRIDTNRGYEPGNIQWSSRKSQTRNRRNTLMLTFRGKEQPLATWAEELNIPYGTLKNRVQRGWSTERVLLTPVHK